MNEQHFYKIIDRLTKRVKDLEDNQKYILDDLVKLSEKDNRITEICNKLSKKNK